MIEVVLAIFAWQKGWKALALIPVGVPIALGFVVGFVFGYLGLNTALAAAIIFLVVDIPCIAVLIFMICRAPKKVRLANAENAWNYSPGNACPASPAQTFNAPVPPAQNFNAPRPPARNFNAPRPPAQTFNAPVPPARNFNAPRPPAQNFNAPRPPAQNFNAPVPPAQNFNAPVPPAQNFNAPVPPAQNFNAPVPPVGAGEVISCTYCGKELKVGISRCDACGQKID